MAGKVPRKGEAILIAQLAGGATYQDAASAAGVAERTVRRRNQETGFRQKVAAARAAMMERALGELSSAATAATSCLRALLESDSEQVQLAACRAILDHGGRLREGVEFSERLTALEAKLPDCSPTATA